MCVQIYICIHIYIIYICLYTHNNICIHACTSASPFLSFFLLHELWPTKQTCLFPTPLCLFQTLLCLFQHLCLLRHLCLFRHLCVCFIHLCHPAEPCELLWIQYVATVHLVWLKYIEVLWRGVATNSRLLEIIGLFCKKALSKRLYPAKETCYLEESIIVTTP